MGVGKNFSDGTTVSSTIPTYNRYFHFGVFIFIFLRTYGRHLIPSQNFANRHHSKSPQHLRLSPSHHHLHSSFVDSEF